MNGVLNMVDNDELVAYREAFERFAVRVNLAPYTVDELDVVASYFKDMSVSLSSFDGSHDGMLLEFTVSCWAGVWGDNAKQS
jgi:hypothetical protein